MTVTIQMNSIFVPMAKKELSEPEREAQLLRDAEISRTAAQYIELVEQAEVQTKNWLPDVELRHLGGSEKSAYLKKLGHRPLTEEDRINLTSLYGDTNQKRLIKSYNQAQIDMSNRLEGMSNLGLILKQAELNYNTYYTRSKDPKRWKAEEMIEIMNVLERLKL